MTPAVRPTRVVVDLEAVRHNVRLLRPETAELMAVVKADAYGHGDVAVAKAALDAGASRFGVALVEEGLALRAGGIEAPIVVLSEFPRGSESEALAAELTPVVYTDAGVAGLVAGAARSGVGVHVKVDTGMHRVGVWPPSSLVPFLDRVAAAGLRVEGLWTHFASSEEDPELTDAQLARFLAAVDEAKAAGHVPSVVHAANSGALLRHPASHLDMVRPGIAIYGLLPAPGSASEHGLRPALSWRSTVAAVKRLERGERISYGQRYELAEEAWIATVPVGYADGYPRAMSSIADVLIRGARCRVAGSVTMDQLMVDCGDLPVAEGDEVVLLGAQGSEEIGAWELAGHAGTIAYEIVTRIGERVPREYVG